MKLTSIDTGYFKLDGGAMFGVVPYALWSKLNPPDDNNLCPWALRSLLIETGDRKILVDAGLGTKQGEKFLSHFQPHGEGELFSSLSAAGYSAEDITDVFITHLHFDHVGGAVKKTEFGELVPAFPNAKYWSNEVHYDWAVNPNPRERASFLKENFVPLKEQGVLHMIPVEDGYQWLPGIKVRFYYGHTEAMMVLEIKKGDRNIFYCADLMPASYHIRLPYVMAYDIRPLVTIDEKRSFLEEVVTQKSYLFLEHDPDSEVITVDKDERGRYVVGQRLSVADIPD